MIAVIIFIEFYFFMINVTNSTLIAGDRNKREMNIQSKKTYS